MHAGPWIAAYIGALLIWSVVLAAGTSPTLWRGSSLAFLNGAFIVASAATMLIRRLPPDSALIAFETILIGFVLLVRHLWLALHVGPAELERILEECFTRTRAGYTRAGDGYVLTVAETEMRVNVERTLPGAVRIRFGGNTESKKARLIRALIGKQFRGSFPALKMRA